MTPFTIYDADGRILRTGSCPVSMFPLQTQTGEFSVGLESDPNLDYVMQTEGEPIVAARPVLPPMGEAVAPHVIDMASYPAGTTVRATNEAVQPAETADPADPVRLTEPGRYTIQIVPPFPWLPMSAQVEVTSDA